MRFKLCGIRCTDKLFTYVLAMQLLLANLPGSFTSALCGLLAGMAYRTDALRLSQFAFPGWLNNLATRFLLPLVRSPVRQQGRTVLAAGGSHPQPLTRSADRHPAPAAFGGFPSPAARAAFAGPRSSGARPAPPPVDEESVAILVSLGFEVRAAQQALMLANGNVEVATNILLDGSHQ